MEGGRKGRREGGREEKHHIGVALATIINKKGCHTGMALDTT
jgi:hypothetical protein